MAAVLKHEPDWQHCPRSTPPRFAICCAVACRRTRSAACATSATPDIEIEEALTLQPMQSQGMQRRTDGTERWRHAPFWLVICSALVALTAVIGWKLKSPSPSVPRNGCAFSVANARRRRSLIRRLAHP